MEFDTASFLKSLFGGAAPAAVPEVSANGPQAVPIVTTEAAGGIESQPAALAEVPLEWIKPGEDVWLPPCPRCGGSDLWETIAGTWRCQLCDTEALSRSRLLADKAARLREESLR